MQVKRAESFESVQIVADADRLTSRAGTALLVGLDDRVGLAGSLSEAMGGVRRRRSCHDPGRTLRDLAVMVADGGDCLADLRALRDQPTLFADVPSDATAWRALAAVDGPRLARVREARGRVWDSAGAPERVILDLDATLVTAHSDKELAAGTYKHGFGFHPLLYYEARRSPVCCARATRAPTPPSTTSPCSTWRSRSCLGTCADRGCSSAPTRAARRTPSSITSPRSACASRSGST